MSAQDLQKVIFTRWVKMKLNSRHIEFHDISKDFSNGLNLLSLLEILSDKEFPNRKKIVAQPKMRPQQIDNVNQALEFCWSVGVELKLKPSAENIVDGNETMILGLLWAIMLKFMKFGDDEEGHSLNAKDALLMWVRNQVKGYPNVNIENMTKSFHNGLAFCALIHKFRPKLINYAALDPTNAEANLKTAFAAAEIYINLEPYLAWTDIAKLDEKSMVVYVSEYFYGIAAQRQVDIAARRIHKVIKFTKEMDARKAEYVEKSKQLRAHLDSVAKTLNDRTIDNTMAGAKAKLEQFYEYKTKDKNTIIDTYLSIESQFNQISMKLADNKRPEFHPAEGTSIPELRQALVTLEEVEKERKVALHAELNRQIKLAQQNDLHTERYTELCQWRDEKQAYLTAKESIHSVGDAEYQLNTLATYNAESKGVQDSTVRDLKKQGDFLRSEKFEFSSAVTERETSVDAFFVKLGELAEEKRKVLDDDLARELFAERIRNFNNQHIGKYEQQKAFLADKTAYLQRKETINSIPEANKQLSLLEAYRSEKSELQSTGFPNLVTLGNVITSAKYETSYSSWVFEDPNSVRARESEIEEGFKTLDQLADAKHEVLLADLAREQKKEALRLEFANRAAEFVRWIQDVVKQSTKTSFGYTLEEVEAFGKTLDELDAAVNSEADGHVAKFTQVHSEGAGLGVKENKYTSHTPETLVAVRGKLTEALGVRKTQYEAELARQRANDKLCQDFAHLVDPFVKTIDQAKDDISNSKKDLEQQLSDVVAKIAETESNDFGLSKIKALQQEIEARGITNNRHTALTDKDAVVLWDQYKAFLVRKKVTLEGEIEHKKLRGLTQEQMDEIERQFKEFDKNGNGSLDKAEFKAALFSLNEDKSSGELAAVMNKYGSNNIIPFSGFREFMISVLGDSDTKEEVVEGFALINKGKEHTDAKLMGLVLEEDDLQYIASTAPDKGEGKDYRAWTDSVYSR